MSQSTAPAAHRNRQADSGSPDWGEIKRQLFEEAARRDAQHAREYAVDARTPVRIGGDNGIVILSEPRLQLSRQQVEILLAVGRGEWPKLPRGSSASQRASRSRAKRRLWEQGLLSAGSLTEAGGRIVARLTEFLHPVNNAQPVSCSSLGADPVNNATTVSLATAAA